MIENVGDSVVCSHSALGAPQQEALGTVCTLGLVYGLLGWLFPPSLLFNPTITAGGDTLSHYAAATYLRDHLLPSGKLVGWMPGNFAGFPLFLFYFPLAFLVIAGLSLIVSFPVAFKLGTVAGTFALPLSACCSLRWMGFRFPVPAVGALFTLCFLFIESNTMWGGNVPSTLAGEFAYSLSLSILVLFLGALYRDINGSQRAWHCGVLFALVGFSHGYTMVMAAAAALFLLGFHPDRLAALRYLARVYAMGGLLLAFWLLPLLVYLPYTSGWPISWQFTSIFEPLPLILWPILAGAAATIACAMRRPAPSEFVRGWAHRVHYLSFQVVMGVLLFSLAARLQLVDVRFLSMAQLFTGLVAAAGMERIWRLLPPRFYLLALFALAILTIRWVVGQQTFTPTWILTNYAGIERTSGWPQYRDLNAALKGGPQEPRVMYEHSPKHVVAGTVRAFEALPLFSGRATLEGAYLQSSVSAPFVFYLQSELTTTPSCPFPQYPCSAFTPDQAVPHLELFNVKQFIAISDEVKAALDARGAFRRRLTMEPYAVYEVMPGDGRYVVPLRYRPAIVRGGDWKRLAYEWFQRPEWLEVPLVFVRMGQRAPEHAVPFTTLGEPPPMGELVGGCRVTEAVLEQEIRVETDCLGRPHLVKVSYHPKWRVEGADEIYLASPAFMVIYPSDTRVRLVFGNRWPDYVGRVATAAGLLWLVAEALALPRRTRYSQVPSADSVASGSGGAP